MTYLIELTNHDTVTHENVQVVVDIPISTQIEPFSTGPANHRIAGRQLLFDPLPTLGPGETRALRVGLRIRVPGNVVLHAEATSDQQTTAATAEEPTRVIQ